MLHRVLLSATLLALILISTGAKASVCMQHKTLTGYLSEKFKEEPKAVGLVEQQHLMEVFVSAKGTWTIVMTSTEGISCIIAAGDTWEEVKLAFVKDEDTEY